MRSTTDVRAVATPVLIVQSTIRFKAVSVLQVMRTMGDVRNRKVDIPFKPGATCTQERGHGTAYDEICCSSTCEPSEHQPCILLHKDRGYACPISVDNDIVEHDFGRCR